MGAVARKKADPTVYRVEDEVGEHEIQTYILEVLRPLLARFLAGRGVRAHVGSDQFIYWKEHEPQQCIAPDIYVLPGVSQDIAIDVWKVWERGVVPSFVLEVVGADPHKDYEQAPKRYAELGVNELLIFDPFPARARTTFQVYRRSGKAFRRVQTTDGDRVRSRELGCFVRVVGRDAGQLLRLATGGTGQELFPTGEEAARAAMETERAAKEAERAAKEAALEEVRKLRAELARRR